MPESSNNALVAIMNSKEDFEIAATMSWYRIPVKTKHVPLNVKDGSLEYIGFYHTRVFEFERYSVRYYAKVKKITQVKRFELFPELRNDSKADDLYYKIEFEPLRALSIPISSRRPRRILFIPTTSFKLFNSREINNLFNNSKLEEIMWLKLLEHGIMSERQLMITVNRNNFILDFALFCKQRNIDIECDGDFYHSSSYDVNKDKRRNNLLESTGWSVLRFSSNDLNTGLEASLNIITDTIAHNGGLIHIL